MKERDVLLRKVLELIEKHRVTAYEIEKNTPLTAVGVQKIINGETKSPLETTLKTIINYITHQYEGGYITQNNTNGNNIQGNNVTINASQTDKLLELLKIKDEHLSKSQEQIDRLISILENKYPNL